MQQEWMVAGSAIAYAVAVLAALWLFSERISPRFALPPVVAGLLIYLGVSVVKLMEQNMPSVRNFLLDLPPRFYSRYTMLSEGFRTGAYATATTIAMICLLIVAWERWQRSESSSVAFKAALAIAVAILAIAYLTPLATQLFNIDVRNGPDFVLALADIVFLVWVFPLIVRSKSTDRFVPIFSDSTRK